jgi:divalent metal cation (Fe/Co/Zn/Cd) transporter
MQSRFGSFMEANANVFAGTGISYAAGFIVYPAFGHTFHPFELVGITAIFTALSIARSYIVRRISNHLLLRRIAKEVRHGS